MASVAGGALLREFVGGLFIIDWTILAAGAIVGVSTAFNALSLHALCTNYFTLISVVIVICMSSIRKFEHLGWLTWAGFASVYSAVLIVVCVYNTSHTGAKFGTDYSQNRGHSPGSTGHCASDWTI